MVDYTLQFTDEARQDINLAFAWFEEKRKGLGLDFLLFLRAISNAIQSNPFQFQAISPDKGHIRRAVLRKFNYLVFYTIKDQQVFVFGILSSKQDPANWKKRIMD